RAFRLNAMQKLRHRRRLQAVDNVVETLVNSGVKTAALEDARRMPKEGALSILEKYWIASKRYKYGIKPVSWVPHWTKVAHPRKWVASATHEPVKK
ncbi:hypothetical protein CXG81DRAFT_3899, partial [Caulochytrium protostelioides]